MRLNKRQRSAILNFTINYLNIPVLAVGFSRAADFIGGAIRFFEGNGRADAEESNHALCVSENWGQKYATEEIDRGLSEESLEKYRTSKNRLVALLYWTGFDDPAVRAKVQTHLAEIRRRAGEPAKYAWSNLLLYIPFIKNFVKPDKDRKICSQSVLVDCLDYAGFNSGWTSTTPPNPEQLRNLMLARRDKDVKVVLGYYT